MATPPNIPVNNPTGVIFPDAMLNGLQDYSGNQINPADVEHFNNLLNSKDSDKNQTILADLIAKLQENPTDTATMLKIQLHTAQLGANLNFITAVLGKITNGVSSLMSSQA